MAFKKERLGGRCRTPRLRIVFGILNTVGAPDTLFWNRKGSCNAKYQYHPCLSVRAFDGPDRKRKSMVFTSWFESYVQTYRAVSCRDPLVGKVSRMPSEVSTRPSSLLSSSDKPSRSGSEALNVHEGLLQRDATWSGLGTPRLYPALEGTQTACCGLDEDTRAFYQFWFHNHSDGPNMDASPHQVSNLLRYVCCCRACVTISITDTSYHKVISGQSRQSLTCTFSVQLHQRAYTYTSSE